MKLTNPIEIQNILLKALLHCSPSEFKTFVAWLTDAIKYNPTAVILAERTGSTRQNTHRNLTNLVHNQVLAKSKKEKVPASKNWKNTYVLGPIFGPQTNPIEVAKEPASGFIPKNSIATFSKLKQKIEKLDEIIKTYNLKINRKDGERFRAMQTKVVELELRINQKKFKHIDYKIQDLVEAAESHRAWINNRTDNLYYDGAVTTKIELPVFDDLELPKLKDMKDEKSD